MRALVAGVLIAVVSAACAAPAASFTTSIVTSGGDLPIPVALRDETGLVTGIGPAPFDVGQFRDAGILADPADPKAFILTWTGGLCDNDVELSLRSTDAGYDMHIAIHEKLGLGCPAAGVFRALRVATREPLPIGTMTVSGDKSIQFVREDDCGPLTDAATNDAKVACGVLITATVGEDPALFAEVTVRPDDGACPDTECSTNAGIEAQAWRVDATERSGVHVAWRCSYRAETASCTRIT